MPLRLNARHAVTIVLAAAGYPGTPTFQTSIDGLDADVPGTVVFHAGTKLSEKERSNGHIGAGREGHDQRRARAQRHRLGR